MRRRIFYLAVLSCFCAPRLAAQSPVFNASVRLRAEAWNWWDTPTKDGQYTYGGALIRAGISQQKPGIGWRVELAAPLLLGLPDNAVAPAPAGQLGLGAAYWVANDSTSSTAGLFLKQAYVQIGKPVGQPGPRVRIGRFEFIDGAETTPATTTLAALKRDRIAHRLIGNFGFSHVQRSVDGAWFSHDVDNYNITAAGFLPTQGVFDVDGWKHLDVRTAYIALSGRNEAKSPTNDWRLFFIRYQDERGLPNGNIRINTYGGHYLTVLGSADVLLWGAYQTGFFSVAQQRAWAFAIEAGWQPKTTWKPWLRAGIDQGSGTKAHSTQHGTFWQLLPTPRPYARFPFFNMMNTNDAFFELILRPSAQITVRADAHDLKLTSAADSWYSGGGAFNDKVLGYTARPSNNQKGLASLFDTSIDYRPNPHLTLSGYFGVARGAEVIKSIYSSSNATLGYLEMEWRR